RAAGPGLLQECRTLGGCLHGEARITAGHNLKARHVIHTPGPVYKGGHKGEREILRNSYYNSMSLAKDNSLTSISFPAISTGIYGYPKGEACEVAVTTVLDYMKNENFTIDVYFVLFDKESVELYTSFLSSLKQ
ncbi:MAG TPA: macro domain-containing protein, partial [Spirochaetota bacterium]|nr:macro domain-containing protein [Spirochaetota bacterium]